MKELMEICLALEQLGDEPSALATVINVEGSAYRRPGARMLLTPNGGSWGMVSGGCLESDVMDHARCALEYGQPRIVRYDSTSDDDIVFGTGLGCNGILDVFIEPVTKEFKELFVSTVQRCHQTRQPGAVATLVGNQEQAHRSSEHAFLTAGKWVGSETLVSAIHSVVPDTTCLLPSLLDMLQSRVIERCLSPHPGPLPPGEGATSAASSGYVAVAHPTVSSVSSACGDSPVFIQHLLPPVHLIIFGGWLDVIPLIRMGKEVGFDITVVDPRQRISSRRLFHEADAVLLCSPEEALAQIQCDARTVAVVMNHHFECDQETLSALSHRSLHYVGTLGPKRRQQRMLDGLQESGVLMPDEFVQTLHGPVGLDIGAKTPGEITLAIMAEIFSVLNKQNARPIRERQMALTHSQ